MAAPDPDMPVRGQPHGPNFQRYVVRGTVDANQPTATTIAPDAADKTPLQDGRYESELVRAYTGDVYYLVNRALRDDSVSLQQYGLFVKDMREAFSSFQMTSRWPAWPFKPYLGVVFRGLNIPQAELDTWAVGDVKMWHGFTSTAHGRDAAFGGNVLCEIHCNTLVTDAATEAAGDVGGIAPNRPTLSGKYLPARIEHVSFYPGEFEVLFSPYTEFRITNMWDEAGRKVVVMETTEFPSLDELLQQASANGEWNNLKTYVLRQLQSVQVMWLDAATVSEQPMNWMWMQRGSLNALGAVARGIAQARVNGQSLAGGMELFKMMWQMGLDPLVQVELNGRMLTPLQILAEVDLIKFYAPDGASVEWYFDAEKLNDNDVVIETIFRTDPSGRGWQRLHALPCEDLESQLRRRLAQCNVDPLNILGTISNAQAYSYDHNIRDLRNIFGQGQNATVSLLGQFDITVRNNLNKIVTYDVFLLSDGRMFEQARQDPSHDMLGNLREMKRLLPGLDALQGWNNPPPPNKWSQKMSFYSKADQKQYETMHLETTAGREMYLQRKPAAKNQFPMELINPEIQCKLQCELDLGKQAQDQSKKLPFWMTSEQYEEHLKREKLEKFYFKEKSLKTSSASSSGCNQG